jgi:hypothetical protein
LTATSFEIRGFPVSYDSNTPLDDIKTLEEGLFVEVKGQLDGALTTLIASKIEGEDDDLDDDVDEIKINGVISNFKGTEQTFMLQGYTVDFSTAELKPNGLTLAENLTVEVEGHSENGILVAHEIEQEGRKIKIQAPLSSVDATNSTVSFTFEGTPVTLRVNTGTQIEDDDTGDILLSDLSGGDFVELEAYAENSGVRNVTEIKRTDPDDIEVKARVQEFSELNKTVTMLGIIFDLTSSKFEDDNSNSLDAGEFFAALTVGDRVKLKDKDSNAVFDRAELED